MPPHWWIPLGGSESQTRCQRVAEELEGAGRKLHSCWRNQKGTRHYAISVGEEPDEGLLKEIDAIVQEAIFLADEDDLVRVPLASDLLSQSQAEA